MFTVEHRGASELLAPIQPEIKQMRQRWADKSLDDVRREMPISHHQQIDENNFVETVTLLPPGERDDKDVVLGLPYQQGWTVHHYIRGRTLQELVFPNSRVVVLPAEADSVTLHDEDRIRLDNGQIDPIAEKQMKALEKLGVERAGMTGYSWGGLTVANLVTIGSDQLEVTAMNIDEAPSSIDRDVKRLNKDFMASGSIVELREAIKGSELPALDKAMNLPRFTQDLARFTIANFFNKDARLMNKAMAGSIVGTLINAAEQLRPGGVKAGYIDGSRLFNATQAYSAQEEGVRVVEYGGPGFKRHASADNVILHAAMVKDGLNPDTSHRYIR